MKRRAINFLREKFASSKAVCYICRCENFSRMWIIENG